MEELLEDKLQAIAVQLGKLNDFCLWLRARIEDELKKETAQTKGGSK